MTRISEEKLGEILAGCITIKLRLRDKHASELNRQARAVNYVFNYCNETQRENVAYGNDAPTSFAYYMHFAEFAHCFKAAVDAAPTPTTEPTEDREETGRG